jgi:hypothetical protein
VRAQHTQIKAQRRCARLRVIVCGQISGGIVLTLIKALVAGSLLLLLLLLISNAVMINVGAFSATLSPMTGALTLVPAGVRFSGLG